MQKAARSLAKEKSKQKVTANIWNNLAKQLFDLIFLVACLMDATAPIVIRQSDLYKFRITKKFSINAIMPVEFGRCQCEQN